MLKILPERIQAVCKSKKDIYWILATEWQCYLPHFDECPLVFLREIMCRQKKVLKTYEVRPVNCPKLVDFNADEMYTKALTDDIVS